jgi:hypothetical protein
MLGVIPSFLLRHCAYYSISGQFGVTENALDTTRGGALPMRI